MLLGMGWHTDQPEVQAAFGSSLLHFTSADMRSFVLPLCAVWCAGGVHGAPMKRLWRCGGGGGVRQESLWESPS